ncbi:MAG: hypothetical protein JRD68_05275 [Deltaproteobacteria bacterium]|nr:hypothetical protein [Deltaproteobacteria bacterium]
MASEGYCGWQSETASWRTEAGHFVNLAHTGIECGTVHAIADGFKLLEAWKGRKKS